MLLTLKFIKNLSNKTEQKVNHKTNDFEKKNNNNIEKSRETHETNISHTKCISLSIVLVREKGKKYTFFNHFWPIFLETTDSLIENLTLDQHALYTLHIAHKHKQN